MQRINLTKYGFVRWPEKDCSDDGNRFTCYRAGNKVRVSKLVSEGSAYLSIDSQVGNGTLPYDVYSKLPHYHEATWAYNGVSVACLTDNSLKAFYNACVAYEKEYEEAEASIVYPTLEEIQDKAVKLTTKSLLELSKVEMLLSNHGLEAATKFTLLEWKNVQEYIKHLMADVKRFDPETFPQTVVGQQYSFNFVKPEYNAEESYWFIYLRDLFAKYNMN